VTESSTDAEARINDLESRLTLTDHAIVELSNEVYRQQQQLTELESLIKALTNHIKQIDAVHSARDTADDVPPHY